MPRVTGVHWTLENAPWCSIKAAVASGLTPDVEPGILPGERFGGLKIEKLKLGWPDAALYLGRDAQHHGLLNTCGTRAVKKPLTGGLNRAEYLSQKD